jgi:hypothetical protein
MDTGPFPQPESIRQAMDEAWRDHHHARDQTWKAAQMEAVLAAGLVTLDVQFHSVVATSLMGMLVVLSAVCGILISLHHRGVERRKFEHILNCEEALGLHRPNLISGVKLPDKLRLRDAFIPSVNNTVVFIIRLHLAILFFALVVTGARWFAENETPRGASHAVSTSPQPARWHVYKIANKAVWLGAIDAPDKQAAVGRSGIQNPGVASTTCGGGPGPAANAKSPALISSADGRIA